MSWFKALAVSLFIISNAHATLINVADGHHNINDGFGGIPSITSLGHTLNYMGTNQASIFDTSVGVVILEQEPSFASFDMSAVNAYLASGGHIIQLGGTSGPDNLFDQIYGTAFGYGISNFDTVLAPSGPSYFSSFIPTQGGLLDEESSTHGYSTVSLLSAWGGTSVFNGAGITSVWTGEHNGGLLTYLAYDYCCQSSLPNTQAQWVEVLNFSINNGAVTEVPEPSSLVLMALGLLGLIRVNYRSKAF